MNGETKKSPRFRWKENYLALDRILVEFQSLSDNQVDYMALQKLRNFIRDTIQGFDWIEPDNE